MQTRLGDYERLGYSERMVSIVHSNQAKRARASPRLGSLSLSLARHATSIDWYAQLGGAPLDLPQLQLWGLG